MALGAAPAAIFRLVVAQGLLLSVIGIALGLAAAFGLTRLMTTMLVGVRPTDPATFALMTVAFFLIAAVASWLPARASIRRRRCARSDGVRWLGCKLSGCGPPEKPEPSRLLLN